jgi:hypothetical protein
MLRRLIVPVFALALAAPAIVHAQDNTERGRDRRQQNDNNNNGGGDRRAEWRERAANFMKERLGATDDEMKVIQPKLEKLMAARRDTGGFGFGRGPGGRGGDDSETQTPAQQASRDLNTTLENKNATAEEIAAKLKALREARAKAKESLAAAQKDLKEVLTQRQEAVLVEMGMLE